MKLLHQQADAVGDRAHREHDSEERREAQSFVAHLLSVPCSHLANVRPPEHPVNSGGR